MVHKNVHSGKQIVYGVNPCYPGSKIPQMCQLLSILVHSVPLLVVEFMIMLTYNNSGSKIGGSVFYVKKMTLVMTKVCIAQGGVQRDM